LIRDIFAYIRYEWYKERKPFIIESVGVPLAIIAALMIAVMGKDTPFLIAFILYLTSSSLICYSSYLRHASWWIMLNCVFIIINIIGIINTI